MESREDFLKRSGISKEQFANSMLYLFERMLKILSYPIVRQRIEELSRAGADPLTLLMQTALNCPPNDKANIRFFTRLQARLTKLADDLERVYKRVDSTVSDPLTYSLVWRAFLIDHSLDFAKADKRFNTALHCSNRCKVFVNFFRAEAEAVAAMHREYKRAQKIGGIGPIIRHVKQSTGQFHDECVADILQGAYDALGVKGSFSAGKLKKLRQRHYRELLRSPAPRPTGLESLYGTFSDPEKWDKLTL
jgi:hypothetical protein